ncbi:MAG TPA: SDR family oxidoreductase [Chloroflexota bacterium]|jgi:NAD(P)-dependent dehydrogenase (short-subunit alcohol dehydrogenase family)|nr:SDR family oxidoreductase [Chloroflexota bacterium]
MDLELTGKVAIVTGGSRGIGKQVALALAREGCDVAVVARGREALEAAAAEIAAATGRRAVAVPADTTDDAAVEAMVGRVVAELGRVDVLVTCAARPGGQAPPPRLAEITEQAFFDDMNTKVMGYLRCIREVAPHMVRQGWGRIVCISGLAARQAGSTIGSVRNAAVVAMAKNVADELGPHGVNVTVVHPGLTRTEKTAGVLAEQARRLGVTVEEAERRMGEANTVRRLIDASEIADVVVFLASPRASAITGDVIAAGGGGRGIYY